MSGTILLHFGHLGGGEAAFFVATLVYMPLAAIGLVPGLEAASRRGVRLAARLLARYERAGALVKTSAFLMVVASSIDVGYLPSHVLVQPMVAALFGLDAAVLLSSSLLVITLPELRPAALILLVAGGLAYLLAGVPLDITVVVVKLVAGLSAALLVAALVRGGGGSDRDQATPPPADAAVLVPASGRRGTGGRKQLRRRSRSRT
jgi:hypothetical protein